MANQKNKRPFVEDPRYEQCNKEAKMGVFLGILNLLWWYLWGYGLGSKDPSEYNYILGFPTWFFMSSIVGAILFTILAFIMVDKFFKDMPLDRFTEEEAKRYIREDK